MFRLLSLICKSTFVLTAIVLLAASVHQNKLLDIKEKGTITAGIIFSPITYYEQNQEHFGLEYEILDYFAEQLGVTLQIKQYTNYKDLLNDIKLHRIDIAAAELCQCDNIKQFANLSNHFIEAEHIIALRHKNKATTLEHIVNAEGQIWVVANSPQHDYLREQQQNYPNLRIAPIENITAYQLLQKLQNKEVKYISISNLDYQLKRNYFSHVKTIESPDSYYNIAIAVPRSNDASVVKELNELLDYMQQTGDMAELTEVYIEDDIDPVPFATSITFKRKIHQTLPHYLDLIQKTASTYGIDWQLLAAISFQESRWDPYARSFTNVRGFMMLTRNTASQMGIKNRLDPALSLDGGTRYFLHILDRLPNSIYDTEDRLKFALAAYNLGFGHMQDARYLTDKVLNLDPNYWSNVKQALPLLTKKKYYSQTKYGYARGFEALNYVENIIAYYNILRWHYWQLIVQENLVNDYDNTQPTMQPLSESADKIIHSKIQAF